MKNTLILVAIAVVGYFVYDNLKKEKEEGKINES
jgi:hypothetical protein